MLYLLYRIGEILVNIMPRKVGYWLACRIADIKYCFSVKDKRIIMDNLSVVLNRDDSEIAECTRRVFRNFCKYLVDFLRQNRIDKNYLKKFIKVSGTEYLDQAFKEGNGVLLTSAHLGNWELGALVIGLLGYPLNIIALSHKDKRINDFFNRKRIRTGPKIIQVGGSVKKAFLCLSKNEGIAILADRDFSKSDMVVEFFGKDAIMPRGVGIFNLKKRSPIVPLFLVREPDDTYSMTIEKPVEYNPVGNDEEDIKGIVRKTLSVIERYVKKYPDQWFMFGRVWYGQNT